MMNNGDNAKLHRPHFLLLFLLLSGLALAPGLADATGGGLASTPWPMFQHDQRHTGLSPYLGAQDNTTRWVYPTNSSFRGSAVIGSDGTIYTNSYNSNTKLFAINPDGSPKWSKDTSGSIGAPAIGSDGTIYVAVVFGLQAYNPDSSPKWFCPTIGINGSPVIGNDGTIYCYADATERLYAFNDNGTEKWHCNCGKVGHASPAIGNGGTIYIGSDGNMFHAITDGGDHADVRDLTIPGNNMRDSSPAIGSDGTIYIGSDSGALWAIADNATYYGVKWHYDTGWSIMSSPAIGSDGTIYVGSQGAGTPPYSLHAVNPADGSRKWAYALGNDAEYASPAIGSDGTVYIGNGFGNTITAISNIGTYKWSYLTGGWEFGCPVIAADGTVYIGSDDGKFYAFNNRPLIASVNPGSGTQSQTLTVTITGCQFTGATAVSFGAGITVNSFNTDNATQITANITIAPGATSGIRDVTVTTLKGTGTKTSCFTVNAAPIPTPIPTPTPPNPLIGTGAPTSHGASVSAPTTPAPPVGLPIIQIQSASLSAKAVTPGTPVTVTADIDNKSAVNGNKKVTLYVNGQVETTQGVTVNSGGSTKLTFSVSRSEPGDYTVYVDGVPAGSFKVEMVTGPDSILIFSAVLVALAFLIGMVMLWRRQRTG